MTTASFIAKNAVRNWRRAILSIGSVAVSLFLLVTLQVALRELTVPRENVGAALRIIARNKISIASTLPARQRPIIEKIEGVEAVSPFTWFGGRMNDQQTMTFAQFAMDPTKFTTIFSEARIPADHLETFLKDKRACVVGKVTADKHKMKVGDQVRLTSTFYAPVMELKVAGIFEGTADDRNMMFHHKYLDDATGDLGRVGCWWLKVRSPEDMSRVIRAINDAFANTSAEVRAETERAFQLGFISMLGDINTLINSISTVVVFSLLLVAGSTMSMAIRERFRELAVLKALGFRRHELFGFILAESFGLALVGALVGVGGARLLYHSVDIVRMTDGILLGFEVTPRIMAQGAAVAVFLGLAASILPSLAVARMSVVQGLKTLD